MGSELSQKAPGLQPTDLINELSNNGGIAER